MYNIESPSHQESAKNIMKDIDQNKKTITFNNNTERLKDEFGIVMPKNLKDSTNVVLTELSKNKKLYPNRWVPIQGGVQTFLSDASERLTSEDVSTAFGSLTKFLDRKNGELTEYQVTSALNEPFGAQSVEQQKETHLGLMEKLTTLAQETKESVNVENLQSKNPEKYLEIQQKIADAQQSSFFSSIPSENADAIALFVVLQQDPVLYADPDLFASSESAKELQKKLKEDESMQELLANYIQPPAAKKVGSTVEKSPSREGTAKIDDEQARSVAEKISYRSPTTPVAKKESTDSLMSRNGVYDKTSDKAPTINDIDISKHYKTLHQYGLNNKGLNQQKAFLLGMSLHQRSQSSGAVLDANQHQLVNNAKDTIESAVENILDNQLIEKVKQSYVYKLGKIIDVPGAEDVDILDISFEDNALHVPYTIKGYKDPLLVTLGSKMRGSTYLPSSDKQNSDDTLGAITMEDIPGSPVLPPINKLIDDALGGLSLGDVSSLEDLAQSCHRAVDQAQDAFPMEKAQEGFGKYIKDTETKFSARDMLHSWKKFTTGDTGVEFTINDHKKVQNLLSPVIDDFTSTQKESLISSFTKWNERGSDYSFRQHPNLKNSSDPMMSEIRSNGLEKLLRVFSSAGQENKTKINPQELAYYTNYIDGVRRGAISQDTAFIQYRRNQASQTPKRLIDNLSEVTSGVETAALQKMHPDIPFA